MGMWRVAVVVLAWGSTTLVSGCRTKTVEGEGEPSDPDAATAADGSSDAGGEDDAAADGGSKTEPPFTPATSGTSASLRGVWASPDLSLSVVVGDTGVILLSTDGGASWKASASGVTQRLAGVWGSSADDVWVVGDAATVLHSTDRGATWDPIALGETTDLTSVWGSSADQIFVGGGNAKVYRTRNQGTSFESAPSKAITPLVGIWGTSATSVWAAAQGGLFQSTDGGDTFSGIVASLGAQRGLWAGSDTDVYTVNDAAVVTRYDGAVLHKTSFGTASIVGVWGSSVDDVYVVGTKGFLRHTTDRGSSWMTAAAGSEDLNAVGGAKGTVIVVGAAGAILRR